MTRAINKQAQPLGKTLSYQRFALAIASGGLLALPFVDPNYYLCAWVAFVPLLLAIQGASLKTAYWLGMLSGLVFYANAAYWLVDFVQLSKGYGAFSSTLLAGLYCLYCAQLSALVCILLKMSERFTLAPSILVFPVLVTLVYEIFPMVFEARPGESQSLFFYAIQATEFVGVHGLDTIIALFNVTLYQLFFCNRTGSDVRMGAHQGVALALLSLWFCWGYLSHSYWQAELENGPTRTIGLVQPNEDPTLQQAPPRKGYSRSYPLEMYWTEALADAGAELVIWPEANYKGVFDEPYIQAAFSSQVSELQTSLLLQDIEQREQEGSTRRYNSALLITPDGTQGPYRKNRRIAFGEYLPLIEHVTVLNNAMKDYLGGFLNEMHAGDRHEVFSSRGMRIIPLICYETSFPRFAARAVNSAMTEKAGGAVIIALSRNSWFGKSVQPYQHAHTSVLRAVENRLPMIHVLNNGPSIIALPNGEISTMTPYQQEGAFLAELPYQNTLQGSFFSRHPNLYLNTLFGLVLLLIIRAFYTRRPRRIDLP